MTVGYNPRCKLCNCEHRAEAEKMHEDSASLQQIADFLSSHDVAISKASVRRHFDTHFSPKDEAAERYYKESEAVMQQAVENRLTDLQMLDATIERNYRLHSLASAHIEKSLTEEKPVLNMYGSIVKDPNDPKKALMDISGPDKPMVDLLTGAASEIRQAIKLKKELLGEDGGKATKVMIVDDLDDEG